MLKIHKSYSDNGYIVYDQNNFENCHTHTRHLRIAIIIRDNVNKLRLPVQGKLTITGRDLTSPTTLTRGG